MYEDLARCKNDPAHTASGREWSRLRMGGVLMYRRIFTRTHFEIGKQIILMRLSNNTERSEI